MRLVFLPEAERSLRWFRRYYRDRFPEGRKNALLHFAAMQRMLIDNPQAGRALEGRKERRYAIPRTPFSVIYRIDEDGIAVLRIRDDRSDPASMEI